MTAILGISAFFHDSAAALLVDGRVVAAAQQERFSREKHDSRFPRDAVEYCLAEAGLKARQLDYVGYYEKPLRKFDRLLETWLASAPSGYGSFRRAVPRWLRQKLHVQREIRQGLGERPARRTVFVEHHPSHAASAFFPSPFREAAILTIDGVGEWTTATWGIGRGNRIESIQELRFPHSLGLLYSAMTSYLGFRVNDGEYKVMGLAPYGRPVHRERILRELIDLKADGSFRLDMSYFNYLGGLTMTSRRFHRLFGGPPRVPGSPITEREADLAASMQAVAEQIVLRMAGHAHERTGVDDLVLAGGVALNCAANGRLLREGPFERIWVQPAAGDAGGALGAAWFIWHQLLRAPRATGTGDADEPTADGQRGSLLGPEYRDDEIARALQERNLDYERFDDDERLCREVARMLADGKAVGWFQGRMEFGPRALGSRSILADPRDPAMRARLNDRIKFRESFRPFAPMVAREHAGRCFDMGPLTDSPYMSFVVPARRAEQVGPDGAERRGEDAGRCDQEPVPDLPAVTHVDQTARVQTVDRRRHALTHRLLTCFLELTGCPVLLNTSMNVRGEPIACTPDDACRCLLATDLDVLVMGRFVARGQRQTNEAIEQARRAMRGRESSASARIVLD